MEIPASSYGHWSSARTFVCVATGTALGIGGIARLPELMLSYGGVAFFLVYVVALLLLAMPLLLGEWILGRWIRVDLMSGFRQLAERVGAPRVWHWMGGPILAGAVMLLSYYSVFAGWSIGYLFRGASGVLAGDAEHVQTVFAELTRDPERSLAWHTLFMLFTCMIVAAGVRDGMERTARYLVPGAFVLMMLLTYAASRWGDVAAAARSLVVWQPQRLGWRGALEAVGQAFFTLGLGFGAMTGLGSYLPVRAPLLRLVLVVAALDTVFSLMVAVFLLALASAAGQPPAPGLGLLFITFPASLPAGMPGVFIATGFYLVLFSVTLAAAPTLLEPLTRRFMDNRRLTRVFAATTAGVLVWYLGLGSLLSISNLPDVRLFGRNFFEWLQMLSGFVIAPLGGLLICTLLTRIMPVEMSRVAWGDRAGWLVRPWLVTLRDPTRLGLIVFMIFVFGVFDWVAVLWG